MSSGKKPFYGSRKESDTKRFTASINELNTLYNFKGGKKKLAQDLNVSRGTLRNWTTGKSKPKTMESFNTVVNKYSALKPTINNPEKTKRFTERKVKEVKAQNVAAKEKRIEIKKTIATVLVMDIDEWFNKYYHKRLHKITKYDYLRNMLREKRIKYVKFSSNNPTEGMFLRSLDEYIEVAKFLQMIGVTFDYPYNDNSRQIFFRRLPRVASVININPPADSDTLLEEQKIKAQQQQTLNTKKAKSLFYSGNVLTKIEEFIGYYFDS